MTAAHPDASQQAVVEAALVLLERMGLTPADLAAIPQHRKPVPTFAEYVPVVSAAVSAGTRRAYGSYWNRVLDQWGDRRLDEPTPSEIRQLMAYVKTHVVARRNARGGRSAEEHLVAALRCRRRPGDRYQAIRSAPGRSMFGASASSRSVTLASLAASLASVTASQNRRRPSSAHTARHGSPSCCGG